MTDSFQVKMGIKDLPDHVSAAVLQFCQENLEYSGHLSVHGSITVVADTETTITLISKNLSIKKGWLRLILSEVSNFGINFFMKHTTFGTSISVIINVTIDTF